MIRYVGCTLVQMHIADGERYGIGASVGSLPGTAKASNCQIRR